MEGNNIYVGWIPTSTRFLAFELIAEHIKSPNGHFDIENYCAINRIVRNEKPDSSNKRDEYLVIAHRYTYETLKDTLGINKYTSPHIYVLTGRTFNPKTNSSIELCEHALEAFQGRLRWNLPANKHYLKLTTDALIACDTIKPLDSKSEPPVFEFIDFIIFSDGKIILNIRDKDFGAATDALINEAYQFIKDCFHKHYHHREKFPLIKYIHNASQKKNWSKLVLLELYRNVINLRRMKRIYSLNNALGVLSYLIAFVSIFKNTDLSKYINSDDKNIESINLGLESSIKSRLELSKISRENKFFLINIAVGLLIFFPGSVLGYAQIDDHFKCYTILHANGLALYVFLLPVVIFCLYYIFGDMDLPFPVDHETIFFRLTRGWSNNRKRLVLLSFLTLFVASFISYAYYYSLGKQDMTSYCHCMQKLHDGTPAIPPQR